MNHSLSKYPEDYLERLQELRRIAGDREDPRLYWAIDVAIMAYLNLPDLAGQAYENYQHFLKKG